MTITLNFNPQASAGYTPRKALTLHNIDRVDDAGVLSVTVYPTFDGNITTFDHVVSVAIRTKREDL